MTRKQHGPEPQRIRVRIHGHLGVPTLRAFPEMEAERDGADTLLTGVLPDRAALYGAIAQLERLGLDLVELSSRRHGPVNGTGVGD